MRKLTRKLFLSICTLAVCAVTLVSTTFAWYTTNTEVSATGVNGGAASSGVSSISISKSGEDGTFFQTVDLKDLMEANKNLLTPVQFVERTTGTGDDKVVEYLYLDLKGLEGEVLNFSLWFKTAQTNADVTLYLSGITLKNTIAQDAEVKDLPVFDNLLKGSDNDGEAGFVTGQSTYFVDIINALCLTTSAHDSGNVDDETTNNVDESIKTRRNLDLQAIANTYTIPKVGFETDPKALEYYNYVMSPDTIVKGTDGLVPTTDKIVDFDTLSLETNRTSIATLPQNGKAVKVDFAVYINGWDDFCFDVLKGQTFTLELQFSSEVSK